MFKFVKIVSDKLVKTDYAVIMVLIIMAFVILYDREKSDNISAKNYEYIASSEDELIPDNSSQELADDNSLYIDESYINREPYVSPSDYKNATQDTYNNSYGTTKTKKITTSIDPIQAVSNSHCKKGSSIKQCFYKKISVPAISDLGWSTKRTTKGYIVERSIQVGRMRSPTIYRWLVTETGMVTPINGHATTMSGP